MERKYKMKLLIRIISIVCAISVVASVLTVSAKQIDYKDLNPDYECYHPVMRLSDSEVINGYEDNTFRPWNNVTRAEFCKIVVAMMDKTQEAKSISALSAFDDVNKVKWCIPYVNYLTNNNIIKGYADATFKPNNIITYAEAVTILLRTSGYNEDAVGYSWPANYINKAEDLKIAGNMKFSANDCVTRAAMAIMVDNVMFTNVNGTTDITPVRATKNYTLEDKYLEGIAIDYDDLTVYKDNKTVTVADIEVNDVVYYNTQTNTMDIYNKKVTGIYKEAIPSKSHIESVNVGGNVYSINSKVSTSKLDASQGSFEIGERVTLLLGKDDEVCFAVELSETNPFDYGILLKTYKETSTSGKNEGSSQTMASIFMADGNTYDYEVSSNYKGYEGDLVKLSYDDEYVTLTKVSSSEIYGDIDYNKRTIGGKTLLRDAVIFNRLSDEDDSDVQVEVVDFNTMGTNNISINQLVTSVSANAFGDILVMYVCDLPSSYQYGMFREYESMGDGSTGIYTIFTDSNTNSYQSDIRASVSGAVKFKVSGGKITDIKSLNKISSANSLGAVEGGRIMINSTIYDMDDNVEIVNITSGTSLKTMSVNELANSKISGITLYSDKSKSDDAIIRLITVTLKK